MYNRLIPPRVLLATTTSTFILGLQLHSKCCFSTSSALFKIKRKTKLKLKKLKLTPDTPTATGTVAKLTSDSDSPTNKKIKKSRTGSQKKRRKEMASHSNLDDRDIADRLEDNIMSSSTRHGRGGHGGGRGKGGGRRGGGGGGGGGRDRREVDLSKALSRLLRHQADNAGVTLDKEGFACLDKVVSTFSLSSSLVSLGGLNGCLEGL
jgi:uncharacterized membrane protein YgcG